MAPQAPLLIYPPSALPRPVSALPNGAERLVAGSGLHTGAGHLRGPLGGKFHAGGGLPLDWFDHDQQRHITAHRMDNVPTMAVLAHRSSHRDTVLDTTCLLCWAQPETAPHLWVGSAQPHEWGPARRRLAAWLDQKVGPRAAPVRHQLWESAVLEQWAAALRTPSMQLAHLECTGPHALGTEFLRHVIEESIRVWYAHAKARATLLKARLGPGSTMAWAVGSATPAIHCLTAWGQWAVQLLQCTAPLPWGTRQCNSCNALPHCLGAVHSATPAMHCPAAWGQRAVQLLKCTASLPWGSRQCNSCNALPHCLGAVGSATPAMHCPTTWGQWAVQLLQCTAPLPWGTRQCNSCNALPHCLAAVHSATPAMHCPTAWGQRAVQLLQCTASLPWGQLAVQLLQCTASLPRGSWQCNSCNALPHCLGAVDSAAPEMHCLTAGVVWCGVVRCGAVRCGAVRCGAVRCGAVRSGVVWCGVVWCGVVWCGVVWCGVVWCGVVWCAEGAVTRRQWPGCLPTGTGKRAGLCVLCARRAYVCRPWWREGESGRPGRPAPGDRAYSRSSRCTPSRSACWCRRNSCNAHPGSAAVYSRRSTAHCPRAVRQCIAGVHWSGYATTHLHTARTPHTQPSPFTFALG